MECKNYAQKNLFHFINAVMFFPPYLLDWPSHASEVHHYEWDCKYEIELLILIIFKHKSNHDYFPSIGEPSSWRGTRQQSYDDGEWADTRGTNNYFYAVAIIINQCHTIRVGQ